MTAALQSNIPSADFAVELVQTGQAAAAKATGAKARDILMVPIDRLTVVAGMNVRIPNADYESHVEGVKDSILANGFYQHMPLVGYAGKEGTDSFIYVAGGFTRLEAAKRAVAEGAPIEALPVVLRPAGTSMADLTVALDVDNTGHPLQPYERAIVVKRLLNYGWSEADIARKMRISEQYVKDLLYMMGLPTALQGMVTSGKATAGHVITLAKKIGTKEALAAFEASQPQQQPANGEDPNDPLSITSADTAERKVSRRETAAAAAEAGAHAEIIPKKTLFRAIDYAIYLPGDGSKWLARWRNREADAIAELTAWKPPRKNAKAPKVKKGKGKGKGAAQAATEGGNVVSINGGADPFDIGSGPSTGSADDL